MLKALDPQTHKACMKCQSAPARYYGGWGPEGLCRACIQALPSDLRLMLLRDLYPADRRRWRLDEAWERERDGQAPTQGTALPLTFKPVLTSQRRAIPGNVQKVSPAGRALQPPQPNRRRHLRCCVRLPTSVRCSAPVGWPSPFRAPVYYASSKDLSIGGIRVSVHNPTLFDLAIDTPVQVEFLLPLPALQIRCGASVRAVLSLQQGAELGSLCLAFDRLGQGQGRTVEEFTRETARRTAGHGT